MKKGRFGGSDKSTQSTTKDDEGEKKVHGGSKGNMMLSMAGWAAIKGGVKGDEVSEKADKGAVLEGMKNVSNNENATLGDLLDSIGYKEDKGAQVLKKFKEFANKIKEALKSGYEKLKKKVNGGGIFDKKRRGGQYRGRGGAVSRKKPLSRKFTGRGRRLGMRARRRLGPIGRNRRKIRRNQRFRTVGGPATPGEGREETMDLAYRRENIQTGGNALGARVEKTRSPMNAAANSI